MNKEIPDGLSQIVREAMLPIRDALVKSGWTFGNIHWDHAHSRQNRTLSFMATSPTGTSVYASCEESGLVRKLEQLLESD